MILSNGIIGTFNQSGTPSPSLSLTLTRAIPIGRILICACVITGTATGNTFNSSDTQSNVWTNLNTATITNIGAGLAICFVTVPLSVGDTVTGSWLNGPSTGGIAIGVYEYTDLSSDSTMRNAVQVTGASVATLTSPTIPLTAWAGRGGLFVSCCGVLNSNAVSGATGWVNIQNTAIGTSIARFNYQELNTAAGGIVSSQTDAATWTTAANAAMASAVILAAPEYAHDRDWSRRPSGLVIPPQRRAVYRRAS